MARIESAYGLSSPLADVFPKPIESNRAPTAADKTVVGQLWIDKTLNNVYALSSIASGSATWVLLGGSGADVNQLAGDTGIANPIAGVITLAGTANEIVTAAAGGTVTFAFVPAPIFSQGNVTVSRAAIGTPVILEVENTDNTNTASHSQLLLTTGGTSGGDPKVIFDVTGGGQQYAMGISNSGGLDQLVLSDGSDLSTNQFLRYTPAGNLITVPLGNVLISRAESGDLVSLSVINSSTDAGSDAQVGIQSNGVTADPLLLFTVSLAADWIMGIDNSDDDIFKISPGVSFATPATLTMHPTTGDVGIPVGDLTVSRAETSGYVLITCENTSAGANPDAEIRIISNSGQGAPNILFSDTITPLDYLVGIDKASRDFRITDGTTHSGGTTVFDIDSTNYDVAINEGNLKIEGAGKQLQVDGGLVTDFIGTVSLSSGTATVANTNIAANDRIFLSVNTVGGAGHLSYNINAGVSFTVTSTDGTDTSTLSYFIVRQL